MLGRKSDSPSIVCTKKCYVRFAEKLVMGGTDRMNCLVGRSQICNTSDMVFVEALEEARRGYWKGMWWIMYFARASGANILRGPCSFHHKRGFPDVGGHRVAFA